MIINMITEIYELGIQVLPTPIVNGPGFFKTHLAIGSEIMRYLSFYCFVTGVLNHAWPKIHQPS